MRCYIFITSHSNYELREQLQITNYKLRVTKTITSYENGKRKENNETD